MKILRLIEDSDAYLNVFPEYLMGVPEGGLSREYVHRIAETADGGFIASVVDKTGERGSAAAFSVYLREGGRVYNAVILAERGKMVSIYRKIHLFDAYGYRESEVFAPGNSLATWRLGDFTVGLAVCFDLRFPELFRAYAYRGVNLFVVPSAWYRGRYKLDQWRALLVSRAHENTAFLIAADQTGATFQGRSMAVSPYGYVMLDLGEEERSAVISLSSLEVEESRRLIPVLRLSRRRLYSEILKIC